MILGKTLVGLALAGFIATALSYLFGGKLLAWGRRFYRLTAVFVFGVEGYLLYLLLSSDFRFEYVWQFSERNVPWPFKVSGLWAGQEGSFLLWATLTTLLGLIVLSRLGKFERPFMSAYTLILTAMLGILAFKGPFNYHPGANAQGLVFLPDIQQWVAPPDGAGLVPSLENQWMLIHPPIMFLGFSSLAIPFCFALAGMVRRDRTWALAARPWAILSAAATGLGLCLGGFWAYETLGWGGFWAWDPVENVSFIPWMGALACVHGLYTYTATGKLSRLNLFLAAFPFLAFLFGTFLTRSGTLANVSVHSFDGMDKGAKGLLICLLSLGLISWAGIFTWSSWPGKRFGPRYLAWVLVGCVLLLTSVIAPATFSYLKWAMAGWAATMLVLLVVSIFKRVPAEGEALGGHWTGATDRGPTALDGSLSEDKGTVTRREGLYAGISAIMFIAVVTLIGTAWPWLTFLATGKSVKLEPPFYNGALAVPAGVILTLAAAVPFLGWRKTGSNRFLARLTWPWAFAVALAVAGFFGLGLRSPLALLFAVLCFLAVTANGWRAGEVLRRSRVTLGGFVAHSGFAILLFGLIISTTFERKEEVIVPTGAPTPALGFMVTRQPDRELPGSTRLKQMNQIVLQFDKDGRSFSATPEYWVRAAMGDGEPQRLTRPFIRRGLLSDTYIAIQPPSTGFIPAASIDLKPGEKKEFGPLTVQRIGGLEVKRGQLLARFRLTHQGGSRDITTALTMDADKQEFIQHPVALAQGMAATIAPPSSMDGPVSFQVGQVMDQLPMTVFYKPLTVLVWLGAGIMALGGFLAVRRRALDCRALARKAALADAKPRTRDHAPVPASKK